MALSKRARFRILSNEFFKDGAYQFKKEHRDALIGSMVRLVGQSDPDRGELVKIVEHNFKGGTIVIKTKGFSTSWEGMRKYHPAQYHVAEFTWDNVLFTQERMSDGQYREATVREHVISYNAKG